MFQSTIKNFNINFNALNARNTISSGDLLTGHISFDLTKETKITSITMELTGKANVHWSTGGGGGGRRKRRRRRHFTAKLDFFNLKSVIVQETNAVGETAKYQPGTHVYPFTCQLPQGCRLSILLPWSSRTSNVRLDRGHPQTLAYGQGLCDRVELCKPHKYQPARAAGSSLRLQQHDTVLPVVCLRSDHNDSQCREESLRPW